MTAFRGATRSDSIDWTALRERLAAIEQSLTEEYALPPEVANRVLAERARALATRREEAADPGEHLDVVLFRLATETFGLEIGLVLEVLENMEVSQLPGAEPPIGGLAPWRGEVIPVLDVRRLLGLHADASGGAGHHLVLGEDRSAFVLPVEEVLGLRRLSSDELRAVDPQSSRGGALLRGTTVDGVLVLALRDLIRTYF